jgi:hypothetical protein
MRYKKLFQALFLLSLAAYGISFFVDSVIVTNHRDEATQLQGYTLFFGPYYFLALDFPLGLLIISPWAWFANLNYLLGVLLFAWRKDRGALLAAECSVLFAYPVLGMWIWGIPDLDLSYGFFLWFGSMVLLAIASRYRLYFAKREKRRPSTNVPEKAAA